MIVLRPTLPGLAALSLAAIVASSALADLAAYRTGRSDPRVRQVPAELQQGAFTQPQQNLAPLVRWLVQGTADDFQKVKILHDWIAEYVTYDAESFFSGAKVEATWEQTLLGRKSVCYGYSTLLEKMCQIAGIPCAVISGYGRGYGYGLGRAENLSQVNHAWNAVQIQGRWYLLDVTWDAGYIRQRAFHKEYSTAYLFPDARQFLHTHFPSDPRWQLVSPSCTAEEFARLPYLPGRFFQQGLRLATPVRRLHPVGESVQFTVETPADVVLTAHLQDPARPDDAEVDGRTLVRREGTRTSILAAFPKPGRWNVQIFSKPRRTPGSYWLAATLEFESAAGTPWSFPKTYGSVAAMDAYLESPLYVPLVTGKSQEFKIRVRGAEQVFLRIGEEWLPMKPVAGEKDAYRLTATIPQDAQGRILAKEQRKDAYWTLVDFSPELSSRGKRSDSGEAAR